MATRVAVILCLLGPVLAALECTDWQGKSVADGVDFYPKEHDACYMCRCDKGQSTMCSAVSCAPPHCGNWRQIDGKCCQFECVGSGIVNTADNSSGATPLDVNVSGSPTDSTMTDLGLRLVASTVTTFLILALLLFLIHRLRQRRLLMALRRYSRRREHFDDSDNVSYSPEFYGIQCPPYEDPPPPYSPPKPQHIRHGEQPPPYEVIDTNGNMQNTEGSHSGNMIFSYTQNGNNGGVTGNSSVVRGNNSVVRGNGSVTGGNSSNVADGNSSIVPMTLANVVNARNADTRNDVVDSGRNVQNENGINPNATGSFHSQNAADLNDSGGARNENGSSPDRSSLSVHFRNNSGLAQPCITMGIQNRGRNIRNRLSDGNFNLNQNRNWLGKNAALNLEIRNTIQNLQNNSNGRPLSERFANRHSLVNNSGEQSSSTTDIGESSTSAESLESSPNFSPASPEYESEETDPKSAQQGSGENLADDADSTVRQFFDRQFGSKQRRYPTTMSQSWTSARFGSVGQGFKQSASVGSFLINKDERSGNDSENLRQDLSRDCQRSENLSRSKSEQLKTNGSLRNPPFKNIVRSQTTTLQQPGYAARVSYIEPEDKFSTHSEVSNGSSSRRVENVDDLEQPSECSSSELNMSHLSTSNVEPGDIIVTRRQDELRELRLSHLLHNARTRFENPKSLPTSPIKYNGQSVLQMSQSARSVSSTASVCSETGEKSIVGVAIGNDAQYPDNSYSTKSSSADSQIEQNISSPSHARSNRIDQNINIQNENSHTQQSSSSLSTNSSINSSPVKRALGSAPHGASQYAAMSQSWHGPRVESSDENGAIWQPRSDTLGRNVNSNFEKKVCVDKDVSNLFFPLFKQINKEIEPHGNSVPSSDMRACASQLYNCETEEKSAKKDKKKHFLKRHSAGCFPMKRELAMCDHHANSKLSHKQKSSHCKERQLSFTGRSYEHCGEVSMKKPNSKKITSRDRKEYGFVDDPEFGSIKSRQLDKSCGDSHVTDLTPPCLIQASYTSPVHLIDSKRSSREGAADFESLNSGRVHRVSKADNRRSKSLGRGENAHSVSADKRPENTSSRRPVQSRKKKNTSRQSFPGTANSFHRELEHVLESQKVAIKSSMAKTMMCKTNGQDTPLCAVTQV